MATGIDKSFKSDRGFGFIKPDDRGNDVFVHVFAAERAGIQLTEGMRVDFVVEMDRRTGKPRAGNLWVM